MQVFRPPNGVVSESSGFSPAVTGVVPENVRFPPAVAGAVPVEPVQTQPTPTSEYLPGVEHGLVGMISLVVPPGLQTPDLGVFTDIRLVDGFDVAPSTSFFPSPLDTAEVRVLKAADWHVPLVYDDGI